MLHHLKQKHMTVKSKNLVFIGLQIIAWLIFVGLCIEAGGLLVNFIFSIFNPQMVSKLYEKLDLSAIYTQSKWAFFGLYGFILFVALLKACLFFIVIRLLQKLNLSKPFNHFVSQQITQLSYCTFAIGIISLIARQVAKSLLHYGFDTTVLNRFWVDSEAFILMAAVIFVIAAIFNKGVELQNENDLTV